MQRVSADQAIARCRSHPSRWCVTPHGAGRASILSEEDRSAILAAHAAGAGAGDPGARIQPHGAASPHCQLVLLKTSTTPHSNYEQIAKLKYELVIQEKLFAADEAAQRAATSAGPMQQQQQQQQQQPSQPSQPAGSARAPLPIFPRLRRLPDSRVALMIADPVGCAHAAGTCRSWHCFSVRL